VAKRTITETDLRQAWADLLGPRQPLIAKGGITVTELAARGDESETTIRRRMRALVAAGKVRLIGVRPGSARAAVYEIVKERTR
jgi:DNA-binding transcriptional ArsR family regulator